MQRLPPAGCMKLTSTRYSMDEVPQRRAILCSIRLYGLDVELTAQATKSFCVMHLLLDWCMKISTYSRLPTRRLQAVHEATQRVYARGHCRPECKRRFAMVCSATGICNMRWQSLFLDGRSLRCTQFLHPAASILHMPASNEENLEGRKRRAELLGVLV